MADDKYNCRICKDAGFIHPRLESGRIDYGQTVPCLCMRDEWERRKKRQLLEWCELPAASEGMTFEKFKNTGGLQEAYSAAREVASGDLKWLTMISGTNRGKTHLAIAVCHAWLDSGKVARYAYVPLLLDELRRGYQSGNDYDSRFEMFLNVPLLVLDDLGTENSTEWVQEKLDTIVDYRLMHDLSLVVTTNLSLPNLPARISSRLLRHGKVITIGAQEYRG
jgi:DNA replication protein DnaC